MNHTTKTMLLLLAIFLVPLAGVDASVPPPTGDWTINSGELIDQVDYIINGSLVISSASPVTIQNSNLTINGDLYVWTPYNSFINTTIDLIGGSVRLEGSFNNFINCTITSTNDAIFISSNDNIIKNSTIQSFASNDAAITLNGDNNLLSHNTIHSVYDVISVWTSTNNTIQHGVIGNVGANNLVQFSGTSSSLKIINNTMRASRGFYEPLLNYVDGLFIMNNTITTNDFGFYGYGTRNSVISGNILNVVEEGVYYIYGTNNHVTNNTITHQNANSIKVGSESVITNNTITAQNNQQIWDQAIIATSNSVISGNNITGANYIGIFIDTATNVTVNSNTIETNKRGISMSDVTNSRLEGNFLNSTGDFGLYMSNADSNEIISNQIYGISGLGIKLSDYNLIENNKLHGISYAGYEAIYDFSSVPNDYNTIIHNEMIGKTYGFIEYSGDFVNVSYNYIQGELYTALTYYSSFNVTVSFNEMHGNSGITFNPFNSSLVNNTIHYISGLGTINSDNIIANNTYLQLDVNAPTFVTIPSDQEIFILDLDGSNLYWRFSDTNPGTFTLFDGEDTLVPPTPWSNGVSVQVDISSFDPGTHLLRMVVSDAEGNVAEMTTNITITTDDQPPLLNSRTPDGMVYPFPNHVFWVFSDEYPSDYVILLNGTEVQAGTWDIDVITYILTETDLGVYNITIIVNDLFGNYYISSVFLTVVPEPTIPPEFIQTPDDMELYINSNQEMSWKFSDPAGGTYEIYLNDELLRDGTYAAAEEVLITWSINEATVVGQLVYELRIHNNDGHELSDTVVLTVVDYPTPTLPSDFSSEPTHVSSSDDPTPTSNAPQSLPFPLVPIIFALLSVYFRRQHRSRELARVN